MQTHAPEPTKKRAIVFIDGSNLRFATREAFGQVGNINPVAFAENICAHNDWALADVRYYLGIPDVNISEDGHYAWAKRCARWRRQGAHTFTRPLKHNPGGGAREKGIDIRLALDVIRLHHDEAFDVAVIASQDQDFSELAEEVKQIARQQSRWIQIASVFPFSEQAKNTTGITGTYAIPFDAAFHERSLDDQANRKIRFRRPEVRPEAIDLPVEVETASADLEIASSDESPAQRPPNIPSALLAGSYLLGTVGTFAHLCWLAIKEPAAGDWPSTIFSAANTAAAWPYYWYNVADMSMLDSALSYITQLG